jgi:hypothetical protein
MNETVSYYGRRMGAADELTGLSRLIRHDGRIHRVDGLRRTGWVESADAARAILDGDSEPIQISKDEAMAFLRSLGVEPDATD